jgi:hypothetical protein
MPKSYRRPMLKLLLWNVYTGQQPVDVKRELIKMLSRHHPEVVVLSEAARAHGVLDDIPNYRRIQAQPNGAPGRLMDEDGDIAILVRLDVAVLAQHPMRMSQPWTGPIHGRGHEARVFHAVTIKDQGVRWRILGDHLPTGGVNGRRNGKAVREGVAAIRAWMRRFASLPTIAAGDQNLGKNTLRTQLDAPVAGDGVDLAAYRNCKHVSTLDLGHHGSDHPATLLTFTPKG